MIVGVIRQCINCQNSSYVKPDEEKCPHCGHHFFIKEKPKNYSAEVIVPIGTQELNRRAIEEMRTKGY